MNALWIDQGMRSLQRHEETAFNAELAETQRTQRQPGITLHQMVFSAIPASPKGISFGASLRALRRKSYLFISHAIVLVLQPIDLGPAATSVRMTALMSQGSLHR